MADVAKARHYFETRLTHYIKIVLYGGQKGVGYGRVYKIIEDNIAKNKGLLGAAAQVVEVGKGQGLWVAAVGVGIAIEAAFGIGEISSTGGVGDSGVLGITPQEADKKEYGACYSHT